jgi:hypothetical protein
MHNFSGSKVYRASLWISAAAAFAMAYLHIVAITARSIV